RHVFRQRPRVDNAKAPGRAALLYGRRLAVCSAARLALLLGFGRHAQYAHCAINHIVQKQSGLQPAAIFESVRIAYLITAAAIDYDLIVQIYQLYRTLEIYTRCLELFALLYICAARRVDGRKEFIVTAHLHLYIEARRDPVDLNAASL